MLSVRKRAKVSFTIAIQLQLIQPLFSSFENSVVQVSDQGLRKVLYQKVTHIVLPATAVSLITKKIFRSSLPSLRAGCHLARSHEMVCILIL